jgi:hypothetical protein
MGWNTVHRSTPANDGGATGTPLISIVVMKMVMPMQEFD